MSPHQIDFDTLLKEVDNILSCHVSLHKGKIPGFDDDDIRQELVIELWHKLPKIPPDINNIDYRFTRYIQTIFNRKIITLHRRLLKQANRGVRLNEYRDGLMNADFVDFSTFDL